MENKKIVIKRSKSTNETYLRRLRAGVLTAGPDRDENVPDFNETTEVEDSTLNNVLPEEPVVEEPVVEEPKKKPDHHIINTFINISYVLLLSLMILLLGLVVHIALGNMMDQPVVKVLHAISLGYIDVVESIFEFIFNGLHSITNVIPDYYTYMNDNTLMTLSALKMIHCYIMNVVIVSIVEVVKYSILSKKSS